MNPCQAKLTEHSPKHDAPWDFSLDVPCFVELSHKVTSQSHPETRKRSFVISSRTPNRLDSYRLMRQSGSKTEQVTSQKTTAHINKNESIVFNNLISTSFSQHCRACSSESSVNSVQKHSSRKNSVWLKDVVISQTHGLVSQVRLATVARISVFIEWTVLPPVPRRFKFTAGVSHHTPPPPGGAGLSQLIIF